MRIALISDIHFGKMATSREFAIAGEQLDLGEIQNAKPLLSGAIDVLKEDHPDYLIVAGDLTSTGSPLEFKYCYQMLSDICSQIDLPQNRILLCMGNHDVDWRITGILEKYKSNAYTSNDYEFLQNSYQDYANCVSKNALCETSLQYREYSKYWTKPFTGIVEDDACIFFLLNSSHLSAHDQLLKHGSLSLEQLEWFKSEAIMHRSCRKQKIVVLHHHPYAYQNLHPSLDPSLLEESGELLNICGENGVELILHGHRHQPQAITIFETGWLNPVTSICAGSISVNVSERQQTIPNTIHCIECLSEKQIILKNYSYTPEDGWFPSKYSTATPVDAIMYLGRIPDIDSIKSTLRNLPHDKKISYQELFGYNDDIKYITRKNLEDLIKQAHPFCEIFYKEEDSFIIFGLEDIKSE